MTKLNLIVAKDEDSELIASWLKSLSTVSELVPDKKLIEYEMITGKVNYYFIVLENGTPVGCSGFREITNHLAETTRSVIDPQYRGMGFGKELSRLMSQEIKKLGYGKIRCQIYDTNKTMLAIKLREGYTVEGYHRDNDAPGIHEYTLGRLI